MNEEFFIKLNKIRFWLIISVAYLSSVCTALLCTKWQTEKEAKAIILVRNVQFLLATDQDYLSPKNCFSVARVNKQYQYERIPGISRRCKKITGIPHYTTRLIVEKIPKGKLGYLNIDLSCFIKKTMAELKFWVGKQRSAF